MPPRARRNSDTRPSALGKRHAPHGGLHGGGDVVIDSAPGRGTRVRISIPAVALAHSLAGGDT